MFGARKERNSSMLFWYPGYKGLGMIYERGKTSCTSYSALFWHYVCSVAVISTKYYAWFGTAVFVFFERDDVDKIDI